jgi:multidrug efflux pump subunit AcrA (membrane-fusion protein)
VRQLIVFLVGVLIMAGCASQATFGDAIIEGEPTPIPTPVVPNKPVYQVERGDIVYERKFYGRVTPVITTDTRFEIGGRILETYFSTKDEVQAGDILAVLDISRLESQLLSAEEELAIAQSIFDSASNQITFGRQQAQLNLDLAQLRLDHVFSQVSDPLTDHDNFLIGIREIERALAQLKLDELDDGIDPALRFDVAQAQKVVDEITETISKAELIAPMDGQLSSFSISAGDSVEAFETIVVISDNSDLEVTDVMDSNELSELTEGMPVTLQRSSKPGEIFEATIITLPDPFGSGNDEVTHIRFDTAPASDEFAVGDRMSITVVIEERNDVLWLPISAIRRFSGREFVVIQNDSVQQRVDVKLGLEGDNRVEILEGVEADQMVIGS